MDSQSRPVRPITAQPPCDLPPGHVGPVTLPGTGREIWWTGRVAIGLRFEGHRSPEGISQSAEWLQGVLLKAPRAARGGRGARGSQPSGRASFA